VIDLWFSLILDADSDNRHIVGGFPSAKIGVQQILKGVG
jgi:hypothetical protein